MEKLYQLSPKEKLDLVIRRAWDLFASKFIKKRFFIVAEASFQYQFANIIKAIGEQYCFMATEMFKVDLETRIEDTSGKKRYVDITFYYYEEGKVTARGAMELKFNKKIQGADDFYRIDSYVDIEGLEDCFNLDYDVAYFCMITDNPIYTKESGKGTTGDKFSMRNGYKTPPGTIISNPNCKGRSDISVELKYEHTFIWKEIEGYYFLLLPIHQAKDEEIDVNAK